MADPSTVRFQPLQDDECLVPCFDSFRRSQRPRVALLDAMMELSGTIGHISASVLDTMRSFTDYLRWFYPEDEAFQDLLTRDVDPWVEREIAAPLYDSSRLAASLYSRAAVSVRAGWILLWQPYGGVVDVDGVCLSSELRQGFRFFSSLYASSSGAFSFNEVFYSAGSGGCGFVSF